MMMVFFVLAKWIPKPVFTRFYSASPTKIPDPLTSTSKVVDSLITSSGLSPEKRAKISKLIAGLKSPEQPQTVCRFLNNHGFTDSDIRTLIKIYPQLLCCPEKSLTTNIHALREVGLSTSTLNQLILSSPAVLHIRSAAPKVKFWKDFFGGDEAALLKAFKHTPGLAGYDINRTIVPKLILLQSHGFSMQNLQRIVSGVPWFISRTPPVMEDLLKRTKELGFLPESKMFIYGLGAMNSTSREVLHSKMELFKSFGWSEDEFLSALHMTPSMLALSENNLWIKMQFFMREVKCEPSYIASNPTLLGFSLEKRLRPRHCILHLLESNGLCGKKGSFCKAVAVSEDKFVETYIQPHKDKIAGLYEAYRASFGKLKNGNFISGPNADCSKW